MSAIAAAITILVKQEAASSHAVGVLVRALIEQCVSVFAFCKAPAERAELYLNYAAVLDWKFALGDEQHIGAPLTPGGEEWQDQFNRRKAEARENILRLGVPYVKKKESPEVVLKTKVNEEVPARRFLRDRWYPEERHDIFEEHRMRWVHDVVYARLCSPVHGDTAASQIFGSFQRGYAFIFAAQFWGAAVYRIVESFRLGLPSPHKGILRGFYTELQWKP